MKTRSSRALMSVFFFSAFALLEGCASLSADLPASRFESPETNGSEYRWKIRTDATAVHTDTFTADASIRPPDLSRPKIESGTAFGMAGSFAIAEKFDLGLRSTFSSSPIALVAKFQVLGPNAAEAKKGDTSVAITGAVGGGERSRSGDQNGVFGAGGYDWKGKVSNTMTDVALIVGTRVGDTALLYATGFYSNYKIDATIEQAASNNGLSPAANYSLSTTGYQRGTALGLQFDLGSSAIVQLEGVYSDVHVSGLDSSLLRLGGSIGAHF